VEVAFLVPSDDTSADGFEHGGRDGASEPVPDDPMDRSVRMFVAGPDGAFGDVRERGEPFFERGIERRVLDDVDGGRDAMLEVKLHARRLPPGESYRRRDS